MSKDIKLSTENKYYVYVIRPQKHRQKSYCGSTNNLKRRLSEHNKKKGAKATKGANDWEYYIVIEGFKDSSEALSCEWLVKHPTREKKRPKEYTGVGGRARSLNLVLSYDRWSDKTEGLQKAIEEGRNYTLYIDPRYKSFDKTKIKPNIIVKDISELVVE
jgi:predicted GIY-YIG superfamily endonuclease